MEPPLSGYRVLDLSNELGFLCGRLLGDLGADVIKVEPPGGDPSRLLAPFLDGDRDPEKSLYFFAYNFNKRSVTLDLAQEAGRGLFLRLVGSADFVVETAPPGRLDALGLGYDALRGINPKLVMTSITPFGQTGPRSAYKGDDLICCATGGFMFANGDEDREPLRVGVPQSYVLASAQAAAGTMLAHYQRVLTGEGTHVDVSVQEAVANALPETQVTWYVNKELHHRAERHPYGGRMTRSVFPAKDGFVSTHLFWGGGPGNRMKGLGKWMRDAGHPTSIADTDFTQVTGFSITQEQVDAWEEEMGEFFSKFPKAEVYKEALQRRVFVTPVSTPEDLMSDPQLEARGYFTRVEHPDLGRTIVYPGPFCRFSEMQMAAYRRPPRIGEHNAEVYIQELGIASEQVEAWRSEGVI